jgi:hypothetical protein
MANGTANHGTAHSTHAATSGKHGTAYGADPGSDGCCFFCSAHPGACAKRASEGGDHYQSMYRFHVNILRLNNGLRNKYSRSKYLHCKY